MLPDHAGSKCLVGRYRFTSHPTHGRGEFSTSLRECTERLKSRDEQHMIIFVLLARPKWRNFPIILQRWCIPKHVD